MVRVLDADGNAITTEQLQDSVQRVAAPPLASERDDAKEATEPVGEEEQSEPTEEAEIAAAAAPANLETLVGLGSGAELEAPRSVVLSEELADSDSSDLGETSDWDLQSPDPIQVDSEAESPLSDNETNDLSDIVSLGSVSERSTEDLAPSHDEALESESDFQPNEDFREETPIKESESTSTHELPNDQKKVPIATDQRSYYDRHEWGRDHRRSLDRARAFRLAIPTLIVLPLVIGAVALSGVNLGFYPFDGSLKLASGSGETSPQSDEDNSEDDSGQESNVSDSSDESSNTNDLTSIATPDASGVPTTAPRTSADGLNPDNSDSDHVDSIAPEGDEPDSRDVVADQSASMPDAAAVATTSGQPVDLPATASVIDDNIDSPNSEDARAENKPQADVPEMDWLDALVAGDSADAGVPAANEQAGSATNSIDITATADLEITGVTQENHVSQKNVTQQNDNVNESEEGSTDVVATTMPATSNRRCQPKISKRRSDVHARISRTRCWSFRTNRRNPKSLAMMTLPLSSPPRRPGLPKKLRQPSTPTPRS